MSSNCDSALAFVSSYFEIFSDPRLDHCLNAIAIMRVLFAPLGVTAIFAGKLGYIFTKRILPSLRYQYYMARRRWLRHQSTTFDAVEIPDRTPYIPQGAPDTSQPKLAQIFNIEHILLGVVDNLCYEDVINLGLTSRGVREAVYPARDLDYRIPKLRKHCCDQPTKHSCYYCCKTVCYVSSKIFQIP